MMPELKPLQVDWTDRIIQARQQGARIIVCQAATGFGKNTVAAYLVKRCTDKGMTSLFMVHRRKLVDQISERLEQFEVNHGIVMRDKGSNRSALAQVASRDTILSRCVNNEWFDLPDASLVLVDEAHHAADPQSEYRRILERYPKATILLLSATPVARDGSGMGPWAKALVCAAPTTQLVREGYLSGVKVFCPQRKTRNGRMLRGVAGDLVETWKHYAQGRPTVLFCSRVQHSLDAVKAFEEAGITAAHVDADTDDFERDRIYQKVADGTTTILSNVGIVGEGFDLPELGCCQNFCEVDSRTAWLQRSGRVMRVFPDKDYGIIIDHAGAVYRHGFPDEDTPWVLNGNADEIYKAKHDKGETEPAYYCKRCELAYKGQQECPQCGRAPVKPPKSIFEAPEMRLRHEILTEAERGGKDEYADQERLRTWWACLRTAIKRNGTFLMARVIFKGKYDEFPPDNYPCMPDRHEQSRKVAEMYPDLGKKKVQS